MLGLGNWRGCVKIGGFGRFRLYQIEAIMFVLKATFFLTWRLQIYDIFVILDIVILAQCKYSFKPYNFAGISLAIRVRET